MKKVFLGLSLLLAVVSVGVAQRTNSPNRSDKAAPELATGTVIEAQLQKSLNFKLVKFGDQVDLITTKDIRAGQKVIAARGSKIVARVLNIKPKTKDDDTTVELIFESIRGAELNMALNANIISITKYTPAKIQSASITSLISPIKGITIKPSTDPASLGSNFISATDDAFVLPKEVIFQIKVNGAPAK